MLLTEPQLYDYLDEIAPESVSALRAKLARSESRKSPDGQEHWLNWTIRDEEGNAAGIVQTTIYPNGEANVAYILGRNYWGKGVAFSAVQQMLNLVEAEFEVRKFLITVDRKNERSIKLAQKLGFTSAPAEQAESRAVASGDLLFTKSALQKAA